MFNAKEEDLKLLEQAAKDGNIILLLGAGVSATSLNSKGEKVKLGKALAEKLAKISGFSYSGEMLSDVLEATIGSRISQSQFNSIIVDEFTKVKASDDLVKLFKYSWKRVYTWNVDDAIEGIKSGVQVRRYINGIADKVHSYEGVEYLQVIHLHGEALKPEHGFIFTPKEYNARLNQDRHDWYRQAATDYAAHVPVFIGSRLEEPILSAELDRARPTPDTQLGVAFLITPDDFTDLQIAGFASRNIVVIKSYLLDFVNWLDSIFGSQITPLDIAKANSSFTNSILERIVPTKSEIDIAQSIVLHRWSELKNDAEKLQGLARSQSARSFLEGQPSSWKIAATDIPVFLTKTNELYEALMLSIKARDRMFLVYGQSGSGKTTALMQAIIKFMRQNNNYPIYEIKTDAKSLKSSLDLIHKIHKNEHAIVYIGDAFIYSDTLEEDVLSFSSGSLTLISSARSGEWRQHIERRIGDFTSSFEFQRFVEADYEGLIERLLKYVPAPIFRRMSTEQRIKKLASSKDQLLIALKEATSSERFTKVITDEYNNLPNIDCKKLFLIIGISTVARTGISRGAAQEAFSRIRTEMSFDGAVKHLDGIVSINSSGRYVARHEIYVRHIIENVAEFRVIVDVSIEILRTYTKYNLPIVKNVLRSDGLLFKFILNHNFIGEISNRINEIEEGLRVYQTFEIEFQLDGHFWLQYGQYLAMFGELEKALPVLQKSIAAYPDNSYAVHALADLQLRVAYQRELYDSETVKLLGDAAATLELLHKSQFFDADYYPVVTLSDKYVGALVKHNQNAAAAIAARRYFQIISNISHQNEQMIRARTKLAHFITHGTWEIVNEIKEPGVYGGISGKDKKRRKQNRNGGRKRRR
ncbi:tetratricopeptide repeat protein [Nitrospirillum amazonense]|uniref:P-loop NTPase n=1 Tax=Nitrospirillum amazonense TaxID=28077 RepID=UPI002DD41F97|nr:tetratricopeptide repeat protein [Nitrospirillum amazonense]MEC4591206.1 tetratricopeptide repeat protein [Nitrospirillum amazonense]